MDYIKIDATLDNYIELSRELILKYKEIYGVDFPTDIIDLYIKNNKKRVKLGKKLQLPHIYLAHCKTNKAVPHEIYVQRGKNLQKLLHSDPKLKKKAIDNGWTTKKEDPDYLIFHKDLFERNKNNLISKQKRITKMKITMKKEHPDLGYNLQLPENRKKAKAVKDELKFNNLYVTYGSKAENACREELQKQVLDKFNLKFDSRINNKGQIQHSIWRKIGKNRYHPFDFGIEELKLYVEFDGDFWHSLNNVQKNDIICNKFCEDNNYTLIRIKDSLWKNFISKNSIIDNFYSIIVAILENRKGVI